MAINVEALKRKLERMNAGPGGSGGSVLWKPDLGTYTVRIVPWPDDVDAPERPFIERWFYYDLGRRLVAPPLNEHDPIREFRDKLFEDRTEENLLLARKLRPRPRNFVPIIVRGEDPVVKIWSIGQEPYKQLISYLISPDWGDLTDVEEGRDITVTISTSSRKFPDGTPIRDVSIVPSPKVSPLHKDKKVVKQILESVPSLDEVYPISTPEELEAALRRFMDGKPSGKPVVKGGGASKPKTGSIDDEFDALLS